MFVPVAQIADCTDFSNNMFVKHRPINQGPAANRAD